MFLLLYVKTANLCLAQETEVVRASPMPHTSILYATPYKLAAASKTHRNLPAKSCAPPMTRSEHLWSIAGTHGSPCLFALFATSMIYPYHGRRTMLYLLKLSGHSYNKSSPTRTTAAAARTTMRATQTLGLAIGTLDHRCCLRPTGLGGSKE